MELSSKEKKLVESIQAGLNKWQAKRWRALAGGVILIFAWILAASFLFTGHSARPQIFSDETFFYFVVIIGFMPPIGLHLIVNTIRKWHGDRCKTLLLKLLGNS